MIGLTELDVNVVIASCLSAVAILGAAFFSGRSGARRGAKDAAIQVAADVTEAMDTTNGKTIGATVHDMAGTLEVVQAQGHEHARRLDELHGAVLEAREYAAQTRERLVRVHEDVVEAREEARTAMTDHLREIAPVRAQIEEHLREPEGGAP